MSDIRDDLEKAVDRICESHCSKAVFMASESGTWPQALWQALDEVGLPQACLSEDQGGSGLSFEDTLFVLRRTAFHAAPVPLAETFIATRLLAAAGMHVPSGVLSVSVAHAQDRLQLTGTLQAPTLSGHAHRVPWGLSCDHLMVVAERDGESYLVQVDRAHLSTTQHETVKNLAGEPRVQFEFDHTPVQACAALPGAAERLRGDRRSSGAGLPAAGAASREAMAAARRPASAMMAALGTASSSAFSTSAFASQQGFWFPRLLHVGGGVVGEVRPAIPHLGRHVFGETQAAVRVEQSICSSAWT